MNNAIVCLTRGYNDLRKYESLIRRNACIYSHINESLKYPLILFHEGNIGDVSKQYIRSQGMGQNIEFIDISDTWQGGYEGMCRFNMFDLWHYCSGYDNILRVDEDCHIIQAKADPFTQLGDNVYLRSIWYDECHTETNATLPAAIELLTGVKREVFYNKKYPYTNVSLSSVKFWSQANVYDTLRALAFSPDQKTNRWGDLPVLGALLNIYADGKVGCLDGMVYKHLSHNNTVTCQ